MLVQKTCQNDEKKCYHYRGTLPEAIKPTARVGRKILILTSEIMDHR